MGFGGAPRLALSGAALSRGQFIIINLCGGGVFRFQYFPTAPIRLARRANWEEQETTIGTKPLFYMNRDPRQPEIEEVWLDKSDTNESVTPEIEALLALQDETCEGTPPPLLALWGDRQERVILEEVQVEEMYHAPGGWPIRAKLSLTFKEIQQGDR
ncbi:MAG TPA: hypothetical protein VNJ09_03910 [Chthonomonadales bacterium]|nr:hypothetical protein [Chthonomonadales bacterium]